MPAFCKATIITDDDRCIEKDDYYIDSELDFDDDITGVQEKLEKGSVSSRFSELQSICENAEILLSGATKTLEYELAFCDKNITAIVSILKKLFPLVGTKLEKKVNDCTTTAEKQILVWLFIRKRDNCKGDLAQEIGDLIAKGIKDRKTYFLIPEYLKRSIYYVTEPSSEEVEI